MATSPAFVTHRHLAQKSPHLVLYVSGEGLALRVALWLLRRSGAEPVEAGRLVDAADRARRSIEQAKHD